MFAGGNDASGEWGKVEISKTRVTKVTRVAVEVISLFLMNILFVALLFFMRKGACYKPALCNA